MVASVITGTIAQRMARRVCTNCAVETKPTEVEAAAYESAMGEKLESYVSGTGCDLCNFSGYKGRLGLYEEMQGNRPNLRKGTGLILVLTLLAALGTLMLLAPSPAGLAQRPGGMPTVISPIRTPTHTPVPRATPTVYNIEPITDATVWLALHGRYRQQETPDATREPEGGEGAAQRAPDAPFTYVMPLALNDYSLRNIGWKGFGLEYEHPGRCSSLEERLVPELGTQSDAVVGGGIRAHGVVRGQGRREPEWRDPLGSRRCGQQGPAISGAHLADL